jgi:hypothetical protein
MTAARSLQSGAQNLTVFLLGAAVVLGCTLFQSFYEFLREVSDDQLSHGSAPTRVDSNVISAGDSRAINASKGTRLWPGTFRP